MVGFVTYDRAVHFYSLKSTCRQPTMLCVPEVGELFLPVPDDLLANLAECRPAVDTLLDALPTMFAPGAGSDAPCSALGAALTAAYRVLGHTGGKVCVFQCSPPAPETKTHTREWYVERGCCCCCCCCCFWYYARALLPTTTAYYYYLPGGSR